MHQILFKIPSFHIGSHVFGNFYIYTYGVVLSIAFALSLLFTIQRAKKRGVSTETITDLSILLLIAGVVGSRFLFVIEEWDDYVGKWASVFNIREGGLSLHGGLIAGLLVGGWYIRARKLDFWKVVDILAPGIAIGMGIGRIGCFFNGCCLGIPTRLPWGVVFKDNPMFFGPRHPTQLYEMILDFIIAGILIFGFRNAKPGSAFLWFCILIGISRFFIEFLRADAIPMGPLSFVQWLSLLIVGIASFYLIRLRRQQHAHVSSSARKG